jgi:hypothetical protein
LICALRAADELNLPVCWTIPRHVPPGIKMLQSSMPKYAAETFIKTFRHSKFTNVPAHHKPHRNEALMQLRRTPHCLA